MKGFHFIKEVEMMLEKDLKNILEALKLMKEHELVMAELYRTCSIVWLVDEVFWTDMEQAEMKHAQNIDRMVNIVLERSENFKLGHPFKLAAIQTSISGVKGNIERVKKREIHRNRIFFIARDIEQSILENKYFEILKTDDIEFQSFINEILLDTMAHQEGLDKKIEEKGL
jgi:hypothetical protein